MEKFVPAFSEFLESLSIQQLDRHNERKIDLSQIDVAYHWLTEGKLFEACYFDWQTAGHTKGEMRPYILSRANGKKIEMPQLPPVKYLIQPGEFVCLTVDPSYMDPAFNEDGSCIVFDFKRLVADCPITEDLTDNGEAEFRVAEIPDWPKYVLRVDVLKQSYEKGISWEGMVKYRPLSEWMPDEIKQKVRLFSSHAGLLRDRKRNI